MVPVAFDRGKADSGGVWILGDRAAEAGRDHRASGRGYDAHAADLDGYVH